MDSTTSNPGGHPNQTTIAQQENNTPMPHSDLTSIPGLGAIPGLGSASPPTAPSQTTEISHPAPSAEASAAPTNEVKTEPRDEGPSVTNALEAMLGGLLPEASTGTMAADMPLQAAPVAEGTEDVKMEDTKMEDSHPLTALAQIPEGVIATAPDDAAMMDYIPPTTLTPGSIPTEEDGGAAEFEADSSPYESSSSSDSSDSSSEEDSDDEDAYNLLSPAEQARILMLGDGGSDDEGGGGGKGGKSSGNQLRTKNEVPEEVIPKPDVVLAADTPVTELGSVTSIVDTMVLIAATTSGEFRVLESGSLLCLEDRSVIGVVAETLGRVQEPLYVVRFTSPPDIAAAGLEKGTKVYYPESHATFVFTAALKAYKGSDASNLHDEEVGDEEIEFSDDEKEMEHKRRVKAKKLEKRGILPSAAGRGGRGGRGEHPLRKEGLSYDDEEEGPYRPLARPTGFAAAGRGEAPVEAERGYGAPGPSRGERGGRGRGGDRGRGDRGRGRGGRDGQGRDGQQRDTPRYPPAPADAPQDPRKMGGGFGFNPQQGPHQGAQQQQFAPQPFPPQNFPFQQFGQQVQPQQGQQQFPYPYGMPPQPWGGPQIPGGAFLNPAFFGAQQQGQPQLQHQQPQQGQQQQQWTPPTAMTPPLPGQFGGWTPPPLPQQMGQQMGQQQQQQSPEAARAVAEMQERLRVLREGGGGGLGQ
jgi:H/ACA ribonucleoprotein complex non-core subunit NAF1